MNSFITDAIHAKYTSVMQDIVAITLAAQLSKAGMLDSKFTPAEFEALRVDSENTILAHREGWKKNKAEENFEKDQEFSRSLQSKLRELWEKTTIKARR